jgi:hypothetical protein
LESVPRFSRLSNAPNAVSVTEVTARHTGRDDG